MTSGYTHSRKNFNGFGLVAVVIKWFGLPTAYFFVGLAANWYIYSSSKRKKLMMVFYDKYLNFDLEDVPIQTKKNFVNFGHTLVDKVAFKLNWDQRFQFTFEGREVLDNLTRQSQGAFLLSAHLGNWDIILAMLGAADLNVTVNMVMPVDEVKTVHDFLKKTAGGNKFNVIPLSEDLSHISRVKMALDRGEFVYMHADRFLPHAKTFTREFLLHPARFPLAPFEMISKFRVPACFIFNVKTDTYRYALSCTRPITHFGNPIKISYAYVDMLEIMVRKYPDHWFNYYDFFD